MFFYGVTFAEKETDHLFDLARIVLQPDFARKSHITIRGPYKKKPSGGKWLGTELGSAYLSRPNRFFSGNDEQNTVFIGCEIPNVSAYWHKPDFPDGVPHITIYDGSDRRFAYQVFHLVREFSWKFSVKLTPLKLIDAKEQLETSYIRDFEKYEDTLFNICGKKYSVETLKEIPDGQKIFLLRKICHQLHFINCPSLTLI